MPNGFENFADAALQLGQRWQQERQTSRLANALSTYDTDPEGAAVAATKVDPVLGVNLTNQVKANALARNQADQSRAHGALQDLITYLRPAAMDPNATPESIGHAYDSLTPIMSSALRMTPTEIAGWRQTIISNPSILNDLEARSKDVVAGAPGTVFFDKGTRRPLYAVPQPDKVVPTKDGNVITVPQTYGGQPAPAVAAPAGGSPTAPTSSVPPPGSPEREALYNAIEAQESSHTPGKVGQKTKYGTPIGLMQTLPSTAQTMALKLGMAYRPDLLAGTDAESAAYQRALGRAAFDESLDRQGNVVNALHDYYGGPNTRNWGPNTRAYPGQVASRLDPQTAQSFGLTGGAPTSSAAPARTVYQAPQSATEKGWRQLSQDEVRQKGLDPRVAWQIGTGGTHDGEMKMVGPAALLNPKNDPTQNNTDASTRIDTVVDGLTQLRDQATQLISHPGLDRDVGFMGYFPNIKGGKASDFHAQLQSLRANTALGVLNNLRAASKTGGGIGRVTNMEINLFQNALGSLDESQSPEAFRSNLNNVVAYANNAISRMQKQKTQLAAPKPAAGPAAAPQGGGGASIDPRAIQLLKGNPSALYRQKFDEAFGAGASSRVLGGN